MSNRPKKKTERERPALNGRTELQDSSGLEQCPTLYDLLRPRFKDGRCTREGGHLSIRVVGGHYVVKLACPSEEVQTTFPLDTLCMLESCLETAVRSNTIVWLPDYESQKRARREAR